MREKASGEEGTGEGGIGGETYFSVQCVDSSYIMVQKVCALSGTKPMQDTRPSMYL